MTDSPAVIFDTFVCRLMITGAPSTGAVVESPLVGLLSDPPGPVLGSMLAVMVPDTELMVVAVDSSSPPQAATIPRTIKNSLRARMPPACQEMRTPTTREASTKPQKFQRILDRTICDPAIVGSFRPSTARTTPSAPAQPRPRYLHIPPCPSPPSAHAANNAARHASDPPPATARSPSASSPSPCSPLGPPIRKPAPYNGRARGRRP